jgi:hypothetical protein
MIDCCGSGVGEANRADGACPPPPELFHALTPTKQFPASTKPFGRAVKAAGNRGLLTSAPVHHEGSIMWDVIINLIYHRSCRNYLAAAEVARLVQLRISRTENCA